jgi:hypothetical protein
MVSRSRPSLKFFPLLGFVILFLIVGFASTVRALGDSTCQSSYGPIPTELPDWLLPATDKVNLQTDSRYDLLSARLLSSGFVSAPDCSFNGLNPDGSANACGLEKALKYVRTWQNQYDPAILSASSSGVVPPKIVKAVIAVETQFWPGADWTRGEIGLGQMTTNGADLVLTWQPGYYQQICSQIYGNGTCRTGYRFLNPAAQRVLQGAVLKSIDPTCASCPGGLDLAKGNLAVQTLVETINASCQQSSRLIYLAMGKSPALVLSYEDYWRVVLANYHAGAGCVYQALLRDKSAGNWSAIAGNFPAGCASGREYIRRIEEQIKP